MPTPRKIKQYNKATRNKILESSVVTSKMATASPKKLE